MTESSSYTESDFIDLCKRLMNSWEEYSTIAYDISQRSPYEPNAFVRYFTPVLLGYKTEIRSFFFEKYGAQHPVFEELSYDYIDFDTLEVLPSLINEMKNGTFPKVAFLAILENPVLLSEIFPKLKLLDLQYYSLNDWPENIQLAISLEKLNMWGNNLSRVSPSIGSLSKLKSLTLSSNALTELPESIAHLSELNELNLSANNFHHLPDWISRLNKLKILRVSNNYLDKIPNFIFTMEKLEYLDLADNHLTELPLDIGKHSQIKEMDLSRNKLNSIPNSIMNLEKLTSLNLEKNPISEDELAELRIKIPKCTIHI